MPFARAAHGAPDDLLADRPPLGVVAVQQPGRGVTRQRQRQLPRQVVGVLDAGVHALRAGRGVDVRGIARDEHPAAAVGVDDAVADPKHRGPPQISRGGRLGRQPVQHGLDVVQLRFARALESVRDLAGRRAAASSSGTSIDMRYAPDVAGQTGMQTSRSSVLPSVWCIARMP